MKTFELSKLNEKYNEITRRARAYCVSTREIVGGMSADKAGIEAFVEHQMHIAPGSSEFTDAVKRILSDELGEHDTTRETGELDEKLTYGICVLRRSEIGPWLGDWMIHACLKAAASRVGLLTSKRGSKGAITEMGRVLAIGSSLDPEHPERVYLVDQGGNPVKTSWKKLKGRVQSPTGSRSIVSDRECAPVGTCFSFEFSWYNDKITDDDMLKVFSAAMNIGIGSGKSFDLGKFNVEKLEIDD